MKPFVAVEEKASEYPQKYHWKIKIALLAATAQIKKSALLRRESPEYKNAERKRS